MLNSKYTTPIDPALVGMVKHDAGEAFRAYLFLRNSICHCGHQFQHHGRGFAGQSICLQEGGCSCSQASAVAHMDMDF